jgi:hypothetical protein
LIRIEELFRKGTVCPYAGSSESRLIYHYLDPTVKVDIIAKPSHFLTDHLAAN